jgi:stearoyl-CoA desaturase (Delta-9 desaturase)
MTASLEAASPAHVSRTSDRVKRAQRIHAGAILAVPALSLPVAAYEIALGHVRPWHVVLLVVGYSITMFGITVGFHRLLTHRAFETPGWLRTLFAIAGSMAAQGPPLYWVCNHRVHHRHSDKPGDPHSPYVRGQQRLRGLVGIWHAHAGWAFDHDLVNPMTTAHDFMRDANLRWANQRYLWWVAIGLVAPAAVGWIIAGTAHAALEGLLWGGFVRLFLNFHVTCSINSLTHVFGYRSFATADDSRNNVWLAIPTLGESWHNNHHAFPSSAWLGLRKRQIDLGGWLIQILAWLGLAKGVIRPSLAAQERLRSGVVKEVEE